MSTKTFWKLIKISQKGQFFSKNPVFYLIAGQFFYCQLACFSIGGQSEPCTYNFLNAKIKCQSQISCVCVISSPKKWVGWSVGTKIIGKMRSEHIGSWSALESLEIWALNIAKGLSVVWQGLSSKLMIFVTYRICKKQSYSPF